MAVQLVAGGVQSLPPDSSTTLEELTSGIRFYLREMGQNVIEIGKRLILAKSLVRHGEWQVWLEDNFALKQSSAQNFMNCARRFSESQSIGNLGSTQMIQMLTLPEGEEVKFIEEQAAEGRIVAEMSVKTLRIEIQKYKAKLAAVNGGVESSLIVEQSSVVSEKVEESVQSEEVSSGESVEEIETIESGFENSLYTDVVSESVNVSAGSKADQRVGQNSLEQFFGMMKALASGGNLQELVEQSAEKDLQALEGQLRQFAALYGDIQGYLAQWKCGKDTSVEAVAEETSVGEDVETVTENVVAETDVKAPIVEDKSTVAVDKGGNNENSLESFVGKICDKKSDEVDESDRHSIISALYQIALTDDENFTRTEFIGELMEGKGFEVVHQMSTKELYTVLYFTALKFHIYT